MAEPTELITTDPPPTPVVPITAAMQMAELDVGAVHQQTKLKIATPTRPVLLPPPSSTEPEVEAHEFSMLM